VRRYRLAVLGGTFDHLHVGHHALLATAFHVGDSVAIGLTTDRFVASLAKPDPRRIQPFRARRAALARYLRRNFPNRKWRVVALDDPFGRSIEREVDALVVSRDTEPGGRAVNRERRRLGRRPVPLVIVPLVLADDLEPVSSRRVRAGSIRSDGRRRAPIRIAVAVPDLRDRPPALRAVRTVFPNARVVRGTTSPGNVSSSADLMVDVTRRSPSGWLVAVGSRRVRLNPRLIRGSRPEQLEPGLIGVLRPQEQRKLFGTSRS